jgi:glycosyltransferase involved in cell wall biosynthesis
MLIDEAVNARFVLVGEGDAENPSSIGEDQLRAWQEEGVIEWWGRSDDMPAVFAQSHVVCLPSSYGEGVPKVLIEAAAVGRPIITYDVPGCREIVVHERNGLLVEKNNVDILAQAIKRLVESPDLRRSYGLEGRAIVMERFELDKVIDATLAVYREAAE